MLSSLESGSVESTSTGREFSQHATLFNCRVFEHEEKSEHNFLDGLQGCVASVGFWVLDSVVSAMHKIFFLKDHVGRSNGQPETHPKCTPRVLN